MSLAKRKSKTKPLKPEPNHVLEKATRKPCSARRSRGCSPGA
ncbi:unnamed protein product [Rhodiola kirilowii]